MNSKTIVSIVTGLLLIITLAAFTISENRETPSNNLQAAETPEKKLPVQPQAAPAETAQEPAPDPLVCLDCHRSANINTNEGVISSQTMCYDCHREKNCTAAKGIRNITMQVTMGTFNKNQPTHQFVACIKCHTDVARSPHKTMEGAQCLECHSVHGEATANDPHLRVTCQACHFKSEFVEKDPSDHRIKLAHKDNDEKPISLAEHELADTSDEKTCEKCHKKNNGVGAPASVLPSKSVLCMLCHNSPLKIGNFMFGIAIVIFLAGCLISLRFWYIGSVQGEEESLTRKISLSSESIWSTIFSRQIFTLAKIFILDIVLQRRILKESVGRWSMHSLIFTAILMRFALAVFTSAGFFINPDSEMAIALIDKNSPFTAFTNDLLGLFILFGIIWAVVRRFVTKPDHVTTEYQDNIALGIIGALIVFGFILEGVRILITGVPASIAGYAFIGYPLSKIFSIFGHNWWASFYPFLWYVHGLLAALFIAYLPFGKMSHMFNTPLTYFIEAISGVKRGERV